MSADNARWCVHTYTAHNVGQPDAYVSGFPRSPGDLVQFSVERLGSEPYVQRAEGLLRINVRPAELWRERPDLPASPRCDAFQFLRYLPEGGKP